MQKIVLILAITALGALLYLNQGEEENIHHMFQKFQSFKSRFGKSYTKNEEILRLKIYQDNHAFVKKYNEEKGKQVFGETKFFDLTDEEFAQIYLNKKIHNNDVEPKKLQQKVKASSIDWRLKGAVTPVKNQGQCGSCWSFSATGILEGFYAAKSGIQLPSLSEQQLVDCSGILDQNFGCNGGDKLRALNYVKRNGITTENAYPYTAVKGSCQIKGGSYKINKPVRIAPGEESLVQGLNEQPVGVSVDATNFKYYIPYNNAVFDDCTNTTLNHDILAVGYTDSYFIVKNSWDKNWGIEGYIYLARGKDTCGVLQDLVIVE